MENNFTKIYILRDYMEKDIIEEIFDEKTICLTKSEMRDFLYSYSAEEIKNMIDGNRFYLSSVAEIYNYLYANKEKKEEPEIELYSEFNLPINIVHILVLNGIRTTYDLIMKSKEELKQMGLNEDEVELIKEMIETKGLCLKNSNYEDRIETINRLIENLEMSHEYHRNEAKKLNAKINELIQVLKQENKMLEELEAEKEEITFQKTYKKMKTEL